MDYDADLTLKYTVTKLGTEIETFLVWRRRKGDGQSGDFIFTFKMKKILIAFNFVHFRHELYWLQFYSKWHVI